MINKRPETTYGDALRAALQGAVDELVRQGVDLHEALYGRGKDPSLFEVRRHGALRRTTGGPASLTPQELAEQEARRQLWAERRLERRLNFLFTFHDLLDDDPALLSFMDGLIGELVSASEQYYKTQLQPALREQALQYEVRMQALAEDVRRMRRRLMGTAVLLTAAMSALSLIVGWLFAAGSHASAVMHLIGR